MTFEPQEGDKRPDIQDPDYKLSWGRKENEPFRWLPRHGQPLCVEEWISQKIVKTLAWLPIYTAIVVTLILYVQIFGVPIVS